MQYIAFDSHKRYTFASVSGEDGKLIEEARVEHEPGAVRDFLSYWDSGSPVAVETIGNWYWIVDEIEEADMVPKLVHARKAKLMMGMINKTDKLDARGMNRLQKTGTLPTVWIPPGELRDKRDLPRTRMVFSQMRTRLKNRIHATLAKYALSIPGVSDYFGSKGKVSLQKHVASLPIHTRYVCEKLIEELEHIQETIDLIENRMREAFNDVPELSLLRSLPGVGFILGTVILLEVGDVERFASGANLASYAGTTPRVHSSGGKARVGQLRSDVNRFLKWAFIEAANLVATQRNHHPCRHVSRLYERIRAKKGHQKAVGAVARHLAEATYWILKKKVCYRDPGLKLNSVLSTER